ncbi:carbohydrate kinase [Isosphaeraceae bacterium EP7]
MNRSIVAVGEVLWDLLPSGKQLGGAPANFTYQCRSLGADARIVTRVGADDLGREVLARFGALGLPVDTVQVDLDLPTGTVDVRLGADGQPHYTIREEVAWDRIEADSAASACASRADAICFGSLAQRHDVSRRSILALVAATRIDAIRVFDVNLRPPFFDRTVIEGSLELANVLKLNDHELAELAAMFGIRGGERPSMEGLTRRFGLSLVALTRGAGGSLLLADGAWSEDPGRRVEVVDTVGAGDAFNAALVVGRLAGRSLDAINRHANDVAAYVCTQPGGTPAIPDSLKIAPTPDAEAHP